MNTVSNNHHIAKNAIFLYIRMILSVVISFYTVRILLQKLGVDNYGIYNVVGGIVLLFSSIRGMFSSATQRFLNYERAKENGNESKVFFVSVIIHTIVAFIFAIIVEIAGMVMLPELNIPIERLYAAKVVFQFSIIASVVSILTIPYDAMIISHERMNVFAYIAIVEAVGKLLIIYFITLLPYDILINYGLLVLFVSSFICLINYKYCTKNFKEARLKVQWDSKLFKELSSFAGWNFAGNLAFSLTNEGINMLLNIFGGVAVNAARGISYQIKNILQQLQSNIMIAYRPQTTVKYAQQQYDQFYALMFQSSKLVFGMFSLVCVPLFILLPQALHIWLGKIPTYTVELMRAILLYMLVRSFHEPMDVLFKAAGKLKIYQLCELVLLTMSLPTGYFLLKLGYDFYFVFIGMAVVELINLMAIVIIATKQLNFPYLEYIKKVYIPCFSLIAFLVIIHYCIYMFINIPQLISQVILCGLLDVFFIGIFVYFILLNKQEKNTVNRIISKAFYLKLLIKIK